MKRFTAWIVTATCVLALGGCGASSGSGGEQAAGDAALAAGSGTGTANASVTLPAAGKTTASAETDSVMVDGKLYCDTGEESKLQGRCGVMDGEISSSVDRFALPEENNQSNFGSGYGYQYVAENTIEVYRNEKWCVFQCDSDS